MVIFLETSSGLKEVDENVKHLLSRSEYRIIKYYKENITYILKNDEKYPFMSESSFEKNIKRHQEMFQERKINYPKLDKKSFAFIEKDFYYWKNYFISLGLTEKQSVCLSFYILGYDTPKIGKMLGISKQAAHKNINCAIAKLRKIFDDQERTYDWQEVYEEMIALK